MSRREWLVAFAYTQVICLAIALVAGRDLNWDQFNYHLFAGLSVFEERLTQDFFPASIQTYFNPLVYAPFYWMVAHDFHSLAISAAHAVVHALNPLLLYAITREVMPPQVRHAKSLAAVTVALGCASNIFLAELGTTFMDLSTSVPVLIAAWLLVRQPQQPRDVWLAAMLLGVAVGLKLTNVSFLVAGVLATLVLSGTWQRAVTASARLIAGLTIGFLASYGFWGWKLLNEFGSPFFPFFNAVFKSSEYGLTSMRFDRFVPFNYSEWLTFPLRMAELKTWVYTETFAPDLRPITVIAAAVIAIAVFSWKSAFGDDESRNGETKVSGFYGQRWLCLFTLLSVIVWMKTSANGRYGVVWLMLLGPVAMISFHACTTAAAARVGLLLLLVLQTAHMLSTGLSRWNPQPWAPTWFEMAVPDKLRTQPHLYLSLGNQSNSHIAAFVHPESSFVNLVGQYSLAVDRPGGERLRKLLQSHLGQTRTLVNVSALSPIPMADGRATRQMNAALYDVGLEVDSSDCVVIYSDGGTVVDNSLEAKPVSNSSLNTSESGRRAVQACLVKTRNQDDPAREDLKRRLEPVYQAFEARCPEIFRPSGSILFIGPRIVSAYYMETGVSLYVIDGSIAYSQERQPVDTVIGKLKDASADIENFECKLPRNGSREF